MRCAADAWIFKFIENIRVKCTVIAISIHPVRQFPEIKIMLHRSAHSCVAYTFGSEFEIIMDSRLYHLLHELHVCRDGDYKYP